jgi:hypothetical protein
LDRRELLGLGDDLLLAGLGLGDLLGALGLADLALLGDHRSRARRAGPSGVEVADGVGVDDLVADLLHRTGGLVRATARRT